MLRPFFQKHYAQTVSKTYFFLVNLKYLIEDLEIGIEIFKKINHTLLMFCLEIWAYFNL